jgi:hypothetical protein
VPAVSPVRVLVKLSVPSASDVLVLKSIVGFVEVPQQTPLAVIVEPPSPVM